MLKDNKINASDIVHTWMWDDSQKSVKSMFFYNGRLDCGSLYEYAWENGTLAFKMKDARMKSVCDGDQGPWPEVPLPGTPTLVK